MNLQTQSYRTPVGLRPFHLTYLYESILSGTAIQYQKYIVGEGSNQQPSLLFGVYQLSLTLDGNVNKSYIPYSDLTKPNSMKTNTALLLVLMALLFTACGSSQQVMNCPQFYKKKDRIRNQHLTLRSFKKTRKVAKAPQKIQPNQERIDAPDNHYPETVSLHGLTTPPADLITYRYKPYEYETFEVVREESAEKTLIGDDFPPQKVISKDELKSLKKDLKEVRNTVKNTKGMAIASLIVGVLSLFVAGIPLGTLAAIFGSISMSKLERGNGRGIAIAGFVIGVVGIFGALIFLITMA